MHASMLKYMKNVHCMLEGKDFSAVYGKDAAVVAAVGFCGDSALPQVNIMPGAGRRKRRSMTNATSLVIFKLIQVSCLLVVSWRCA
jgi:hypothetical protein